MLAAVSDRFSIPRSNALRIKNQLFSRSNAFKIAFVSLQSLQLLQYSGLLEAQARKLRRDALRLQTAALCGTATTNFLDIMESFFGVEEDEGEAELKDAASMAAFVRANIEERAKDAKSKSLAVS